jgi:hypothetical protein
MLEHAYWAAAQHCLEQIRHSIFMSGFASWEVRWIWGAGAMDSYELSSASLCNSIMSKERGIVTGDVKEYGYCHI